MAVLYNKAAILFSWRFDGGGMRKIILPKSIRIGGLDVLQFSGVLIS